MSIAYEEHIQKAVIAHIKDGMRIRIAADIFNVKKSTIFDRIQGSRTVIGPPTKLSPLTERFIVELLLTMMISVII